MRHIQKILVGLGETVDMDDDTEDKRRLDRAQVLVKTPWSPTIKHTVDVRVFSSVCSGGVWRRR